MSKLNVGGEVDILTKEVHDVVAIQDYSEWDEGYKLTESLKDNLDTPQLNDLDNLITERLSANIYYLAMRTHKDYTLYCKNTKFGSVVDLVEEDKNQPKVRTYFARLDLLFNSLYEKYPNDLVEISNLLQKGEFEVTSDSSFKVGNFEA